MNQVNLIDLYLTSYLNNNNFFIYLKNFATFLFVINSKFFFKILKLFKIVFKI